MNLLKSLRALACVVLLHSLMAAPALAEPATRATLLAYFEVTHARDLATNAIDSINGARAREWQAETDPALRAKKKADFERVDALIRKYVSWEAFEPMALESYQRQMQEAEVLALVAYAKSPGGRLLYDKFNPALVKVLPELMAYMDKRVDELSDREPGAVTPPAYQLPSPGTKAALAYQMLLSAPGGREEFNAGMAAIEANMLKAMAMISGDGNSKMAASLKAMADTMRREIIFEEIAVVKAGLLADSLSEAEMTLLTADFRSAELTALLAKHRAAERDLKVLADRYIQSTLVPVIASAMSSSKPAPKKK